MMSAPNLFVADDLQRHPVHAGLPGGRYVLARPMGWQGGLYGLRIRFNLAWHVFTGKYDAVKWIDQ